MHAMNMKKTSSNNKPTIALNKKARHEYHLQDRIEAGLELQGWEVKSIRSGKINITESFVAIEKGEAFVLGTTIQPLNQASTHVVCDPKRKRKLLIKRRELDKLVGSVERQGYSIIPTAMYWSKNWVKIEIYLAKGKQEHDKRDSIKDRDWARDKERMMKHKV
jgi:SsrA-binding protein